MFNDIAALQPLTADLQTIFTLNLPTGPLGLDTATHSVSQLSRVVAEGKELDQLATALFSWFHQARLINLEASPVGSGRVHETVPLLARPATPAMPNYEIPLNSCYTDLVTFPQDPSAGATAIISNQVNRAQHGATAVTQLILLLCEPSPAWEEMSSDPLLQQPLVLQQPLALQQLLDKLKQKIQDEEIKPLVCPTLCAEGLTRNLDTLTSMVVKPGALIFSAATSTLLSTVWQYIDIFIANIPAAERVNLSEIIRLLRDKKKLELDLRYSELSLRNYLTTLNIRYQSQIYYDPSQKYISMYTGTFGTAGIAAGTMLMLANLCIPGAAVTGTGFVCFLWAVVDSMFYHSRRLTAHETCFGSPEPINIEVLIPTIIAKLLVKDIAEQQPCLGASEC